MYRTVVTIFTTEWSLYISHSSHHTYRSVVTICTARWSPYVPPALPTHCIYVFCVDLRTIWGNFLHGFNSAVNFCASGKGDFDVTMGMGACKRRTSGRDLATFKQTCFRLLEEHLTEQHRHTILFSSVSETVTQSVSQSVSQSDRQSDRYTAHCTVRISQHCEVSQRSWNLKPKCVEALCAAGNSCSCQQTLWAAAKNRTALSCYSCLHINVNTTAPNPCNAVSTGVFVAFTIYCSRRSATKWTLQSRLLGTDSGNRLSCFIF